MNRTKEKPRGALTDRDVAESAIAVLMERGHTHGLSQDAEGHVCILGAIGCALTGKAGDGYDIKDSRPSLFAQLLALVGSNAGDEVPIYSWNDERDDSGYYIRYLDDAVALLRQVQS